MSLGAGYADKQDMSGIPPSMISQYTNMLAKTTQVTPEMQAAMQRL